MRRSAVSSVELNIDFREIMLPDKFDDSLLEAKSIPLFLIRAWTVMPLSRYMDDKNGVETQDIQWVQRLNTHERKKWIFPFLGKRQEVFPSVQEVLSCFKQIRRFYGWQSGMSDLLRNTYPEIAKILYEGDGYSSVVHLGRLNSKYAPLDSWQKVFELVEDGNTHPNWKPKADEVQKGVELLKKAVGGLELIDRIFKEASQRQGVHVIYGGDGFVEYYAAAQKNETLDSGVGNATKMKNRIPLKFATAVLPLGAYEREKLLLSR